MACSVAVIRARPTPWPRCSGATMTAATPAIGRERPCHHWRMSWYRADATSWLPWKAAKIRCPSIAASSWTCPAARRFAESADPGTGPKARRTRSKSASRSSPEVSSRISVPPRAVRCVATGSNATACASRARQQPGKAGRREDGQASAELLHDVVGHGVVGVHVLHVVGVIEGVDDPEHAPGLLLVDRDLHGRHERDVGGLVVDAGVLQRAAHRHHVTGLAGHLEGVAEVADLLGARFEHGVQDVILGDAARLADDDDALAVEQVGHRARVGHGPAVPAERGANVRGGPVPVVGQALDQHRHPAGAVALVGDVLVGGAAGLLAGAAADRPVDVIVRHRALLRLLDGVVQRRGARGIPAAGPRRHLDVLDQLGEQLAALGVDHRLLVLCGRPLGVAAHLFPFTMSTKSSWIRVSGVSSGWNDVASKGPWRTATILSARASVPRISTLAPACSTHGARMNTARSAGPAMPFSRMSDSNESTCLPNALRRTVMSIPPKVCCPAAPSTRRSASMIIPAQEPNAGRPADSILRTGSSMSKETASRQRVVDSPPGITSPSTDSSSSGRRTAMARAPACPSARTCSRTSPCRARTPMSGAAEMSGTGKSFGHG